MRWPHPASVRVAVLEHRLGTVLGAVLGCLLLAVLIGSCSSTAGLATVAAGDRDGDEIAVCGQFFDIGTPVVLWSDPDGYDAYSEIPRFEAPQRDSDGKIVRKRRYGTRRGLPDDVATRVAESGWTLPDLRRVATQFVLHYDVCGTSRQCFKILQDKRDLSVHFLLDVDGTIYQTLDLQERAWHAGAANDRAVGIEIAHIGAYPAPGHPVMRSWYDEDEDGLRVTFPKWMTELGIRTPDFVARPERSELLEAEIHGKRYWQHDFTAEQNRALAKLVAGLHRVLEIPLDHPRDADGALRYDALDETELQDFRGVLGHWHVTTNKTDPGPAMDWDRLLEAAARSVDD